MVNKTKSRAADPNTNKTKVARAKAVIANLPEKSKTEEVVALSVRSSPEVADELEPYEFDGRDENGKLLDVSTRRLLEESALNIKRALRTQLVSVIVIGRELIKVKQAIKDRTYMRWFENSLSEHFSLDTAENYVNAARLAEQYSMEQLNSMPLNALYVLGRSTVDKELQAHVLTELAPSAQEQGTPLNKRDVQKIVKAFRRLQLENVQIADEIKPILVSSKISESPEELQRLSRLSVKKQKEVAPVLKENPTADLKQALTILRQRNGEDEDETLEAEIIATHVKQSVETRQGDWISLLQKTESESVDLCFAEMPLAREALGDYKILASEMERILRPGGMLLSVVSQANIQFVGPCLEPLNVLWTFMLMRRPGHSPRIVGRVSFASSYIPLSLSYKSPLKAIPGLVDDLRTGIPEDIMKFHFQEAGEDNVSKESSFGLVSIESSVEYYIDSLLQQGDTFMHLVRNYASSFKINDHLYDYVQNQAGAGKVISLIGI